MASVTKGMGNLSVSERNQTMKGKSTIFEMKVEKGRKVHRYEVTITKLGKDGDNTRVKVLTKQTDLSLRTIQRKVCRDIIKYLHAKGQIPGDIVYDNKATLFSTSDKVSLNIQMPSTQIGGDVEFYCKSCPITIYISVTAGSLDYSNFKSSIITDIRNAAQTDHSVRQFLELVTSQGPQNSGQYDAIGAGTLFRTETQPCVPGMQIRTGISKGVKIAEDEKQLKAFLVCDMRRSAFFETGKSLLQIYNEIAQKSKNPVNEFNNIFSGVRMRGEYLKGANFTFLRLSKEKISHNMYNIKNNPSHNGSIPDYYAKKYNVRINPNAPGAVPDEPTAKIYPMDQIFVCPGQVVPNDKVTGHPFAIKNVLAVNSIAPDERYKIVCNEVRNFASGSNAEYLKKFGIEILPSSNDVTIERRRCFKLQAGGNKTITPQQNTTFMRDAEQMKLLSANKIKTWWVLVRDLPKDKTNAYMKYFIETLKSSGLPTPPPAKIVAVPDSRNGPSPLDDIFKEAKAAKVQFIFYIAGAFTKDHAHLKLLETWHKILTQQVDSKNAFQIKPQTIKNVILKMNAKAFGLNYHPIAPPSLVQYDLNKATDLLVIGYDVAHPPPATAKDRALEKHGHFKDVGDQKNDLQSLTPSVVGMSANKWKVPTIFGGDFFYQESRKENVNGTSLNQAMRDVLENVKPNRQIKRIVIFRDGLSEGQFEMAVSNELLAIKDAIAHIYPNSAERPKVTFLIATKNHNKRFYETKGNGVENTKPGDMVKDKVTRKDVNEFYFQAHHPIRGVPKATQYTVLVNELNMTQEQFESFIFLMSQDHQVSACATSLPLPIYMADELAKRGSDIFHALTRLPEHHEIRKKYVALAKPAFQGRWDHEALTRLLQYKGDMLTNTRFNA